jgi:hypothetical protein
MAISSDVMRLVRTVEKLPLEDQDKILRIVDLLSLVPLPVQHRTQTMLRALLDSDPESKRECVAGVDEVISYLESNVTLTLEMRNTLGHLAYPFGGSARLT